MMWVFLGVCFFLGWCMCDFFILYVIDCLCVFGDDSGMWI